MKEIATVPVKVSNGNKDMEVFEYEGGFCMTTEFLGQCIGYTHPRQRMAELFRRHKAALEPHQFVITGDDKSDGNKLRANVTYSDRGRPSFFYDEEGIVKAFMLANTPQAREFGPQVIDYLKHLNAKRTIQTEKYWFGKRPFWPEVRQRVMQGETFREIAEAMGRSSASVRNAVRRMIEVGILQPLRAAQALTGGTRKTVLRYGIGWGQPKPAQQGLFDGLPATEEAPCQA